MKTFLIIHKHKLRMLLAISIFTACNKNFETPPFNQDPEIEVTMSIAELKGKYQGIGIFQTIEDDKVISGIVVADDRSGNFYKQIVIQDSTGGIPIQIDKNSIYTNMPIGRKIYVKVKGLMLGDYGGTIQLGLDSVRSANNYLNLGRIPDLLIDNYIVGGSYGHVIEPKIIKLSDFPGNITSPLLSTLVQIKNAEFSDADLSKTLGNAASPSSESARSFKIKPCDDTKSITLRNSSYATFAGLTVPQGNGNLIGIPSVFNGTLQLVIRDTSDFDFNQSRCSGQTPIISTKTIAEILAYAKGDSTIPNGVSLEGIIISDTKNEAAGNYRLQDATAGIQLRFVAASNPKAAVGDKYLVYVGGLRLSVYNGSIQINNVETSSKTGTGTIIPKEATMATILASGRNWESQLITIKNVTISGTGSNYEIKDATGKISTFVRNNSGINMPTAADQITGYISLYQGANDNTPIPQLVLRNQNDIVGGSSNTPGGGESIDIGKTSPFVLNFDNIGNGLPTGVRLYTSAKSDAVGAPVTLTTQPVNWNNSNAAFKNFASGTGLPATASTSEQNAASNRALGLRQTGSFGDPGAAIAFVLNNTEGKSNLKAEFLLQQLDASANGRSVTWTVDYGTGDNPGNFTPITSDTLILGTFSSKLITFNLPSSLNNLSSKVWIRIVTLSASTGAGSRPSTAIDDFKISW